MSDIKRMDIKEFVEEGFLQEANRKFFHPLGLALEVAVDADGTTSLSGVWDYRDDPEGMFFGDNIMSRDKMENVARLRASKADVRKRDPQCDLSGIQQLDLSKPL